MNLFRFLHCTLLLFSATLCCRGQQYNLVSNPSFEQYASCPDDHSQIENATGWQMWRGTPDFFHACDLSQFVGTPLNMSHGFQAPLNGLGYGGLIAMAYNNQPEVMGIELLEPLQVGQQYYLSFSWSRTFGGGFHANCDCASSHLGALLTTEEYNSVSNPFQHSSFAHVYDDELLTDSTNWQSISGWVTADEPYTHLGIGTFFNLDEIEVAYFNGSPQEIFLKTYYYIDGVCVATDPAYCDVVLNTGSTANQNIGVQVYPNPASNYVLIETLGEFTCHLMQITGKHIRSTVGHNQTKMELTDLPQGAYVLKIETNSGVVTKKIIKIP